MSFGFGFALPAYPLRGGGGNNPFNQSGPTLDLSFAGVVTNLSDPNGYTLTTDFIVPQYQVAAQYTIWETGVGLVDKTFGDIITFTRASSATFVGSNGLIQTAATNAPRFDYDPVTLAARGLLIEEQRTNLLTYSEDWTDPSWGKTNVTVTPNAITSPSGAVNASKLEVTTTSATIITKNAAVTGTSATYSIYVKQGSGPTDAADFAIRNNTTSTNLISGSINYSTGVWTYSIGSTGVTVTNAGNNWWKLSISATSGITSGDLITVYPCFLGGVRSAGTFAYVWGAQLEAGSFATSYIPTVASQVTRSADVASVNTLSPWYNATEGTLYAEADAFVNPSNAVTVFSSVSIDDATTSNTIRAFVYNGKWGVSVNASGVLYCDLQQTGSYTANTPAKSAFAFKADDFALSVNGNAVLTDTSGLIPTVSRMTIGSRTGVYLNGHIRRITYYPRRLSNAELQAITA